MSVYLALRNLIQDRTRLVLSMLGVALAVGLIVILDGFVFGLHRQVTAYLDHAPGSVIVSQEGVTNLLGATSLLPPGSTEEVERVDGVSQVFPVLSQFIILDLHDLKQAAYLIGYPYGDGDAGARGGPWKIVAGRAPLSDDEMVFDRVLAERHDLALGDPFQVMGETFEIVGLSDETTSYMTSFIFLSKPAAEGLFRAPGATSYLLVEIEPGADVETVIASSSAISGVDALAKSEMIENDSKLMIEVFSAPLKLMTVIAFLVGVLVVGMMTYTSTIERQVEYGVLKSVGAQSSFLYQLVSAQAAFSALVGSGLGVGVAAGLGALIMQARPEFLILLRSSSIWIATLSGLGIAIVAAILPARAIARLRPADVFRAGT